MLQVGGRRTAHLAYAERRGILEDLQLAGQGWFTPDVYEDGPALFAAVVDGALEGVVAKRLADPYRPGDLGWAKIKNRHYWRFGQERELARSRRGRRPWRPMII